MIGFAEMRRTKWSHFDLTQASRECINHSYPCIINQIETHMFDTKFSNKDSRVQGKVGSSRGARRYPYMHSHIVAAASLDWLLAGHLVHGPLPLLALYWPLPHAATSEI